MKTSGEHEAERFALMTEELVYLEKLRDAYLDTRLERRYQKLMVLMVISQ